jgi:(4S)-4-hydroxy-5-phosphonooxypentane-2,3-dione isomerase
MFAILGIIKVKAEHLEAFVAEVRLHAERSLGEPGCLRFDVLQDVGDPQTICLYEVFRSDADLNAHRDQDYYRRWMGMSREWRDHTAYSRRVLRPLHPPEAEWH